MTDSTQNLQQLQEKLVSERTAGLSQYYLAQKMLEEADEKIKSASQRLQILSATQQSQVNPNGDQ